MGAAAVIGQEQFERRRAKTLKEKVLLIPDMENFCFRMMAGVFRGAGIKAQVMESCRGLDLGKQHTSGKECYPCQVTLGDVLHHLKKEQQRLGAAFDPAQYVYFLGEAEGPCRFGMYSKYQRMVLDSYPEFKQVGMTCLTTNNLYGFEGLSNETEVARIRKGALLGMVAGDMLRRLLWRIRPYERRPGIADQYLEAAIARLETAFEDSCSRRGKRRIMRELEQVLKGARDIADLDAPRKPRIGIVGEIYMRVHTQANQELIRALERHGGEVVNASVTEWVSYVAYDALREAKRDLRLSLKRGRLPLIVKAAKQAAASGAEYLYQYWHRERLYRWACSIVDLAPDHDPGHLEKRLVQDGRFSFDVRTESCISLAGILSYADMGFNGIVNVYPFTCMPGLTVTAIARPMANKLGVPYLDLAYDESQQAGRETVIRTFMYQAAQHYERRGSITKASAA